MAPLCVWGGLVWPGGGGGGGVGGKGGGVGSVSVGEFGGAE